MIVRINGQEVHDVKSLEIMEGASTKQALTAVGIGILACIIWWSIWA
jgi:hypothetical protein